MLTHWKCHDIAIDKVHVLRTEICQINNISNAFSPMIFSSTVTKDTNSMGENVETDCVETDNNNNSRDES